MNARDLCMILDRLHRGGYPLGLFALKVKLPDGSSLGVGSVVTHNLNHETEDPELHLNTAELP